MGGGGGGIFILKQWCSLFKKSKQNKQNVSAERSLVHFFNFSFLQHLPLSWEFRCLRAEVSSCGSKAQRGHSDTTKTQGHGVGRHGDITKTQGHGAGRHSDTTKTQ